MTIQANDIRALTADQTVGFIEKNSAALTPSLAAVALDKRCTDFIHHNIFAALPDRLKSHPDVQVAYIETLPNMSNLVAAILMMAEDRNLTKQAVLAAVQKLEKKPEENRPNPNNGYTQRGLILTTEDKIEMLSRIYSHLPTEFKNDREIRTAMQAVGFQPGQGYVVQKNTSPFPARHEVVPTYIAPLTGGFNTPVGYMERLAKHYSGGLQSGLIAKALSPGAAPNPNITPVRN